MTLKINDLTEQIPALQHICKTGILKNYENSELDDLLA